MGKNDGVGLVIQMCGKWDGTHDGFKAIIYALIEADVNLRAITDHFGLTPNSIFRWVNGTANPHLGVQRILIRELPKCLQSVIKN